MKEAITSFEEQVKVRVISVENGRKFQSGGGGEAKMPEGAVDLRDDRRLGGFRDAVARFASFDCDGRGARVSGPGCAASRAVRDAEGEERRAT